MERTYHVPYSHRCKFADDEKHKGKAKSARTAELILVADSGASMTMISKKAVLQLYLSGNHTIEVADGKGMKAEGLGTAMFETNGGLGRIDNILHCPTLSSNLLSVGRLDKGDRYCVTFLRWRILYSSKTCDQEFHSRQPSHFHPHRPTS